jgi:hypothetical protein
MESLYAAGCLEMTSWMKQRRLYHQKPIQDKAVFLLAFMDEKIFLPGV